MTFPVAAMILTLPERPRFLARALECVKTQTYAPVYPVLIPARPNTPIGKLRNEACDIASRLGAIAVVHFDDDDWSAPDRIEIQMKQLKASQSHGVGCNRMLFWDSTRNEAWQYRNQNPRYALGTSLCYWMGAWKRQPFEELQTGEDTRWSKLVRPQAHDAGHMMIAECHGGNTAYGALPNGEAWTRAASEDEWCRERMRLA